MSSGFFHTVTWTNFPRGWSHFYHVEIKFIILTYKLELQKLIFWTIKHHLKLSNSFSNFQTHSSLGVSTGPHHSTNPPDQPKIDRPPPEPTNPTVSGGSPPIKPEPFGSVDGFPSQKPEPPDPTIMIGQKRIDPLW